jgi:hypothetical protein
VCARGADLAASAGHSASPLEATKLAFKPIFSTPNVVALCLGALCLVALEVAAHSVIPHLAPPVAGSVLPFTFILPGVVIGIAAKRSPVMHGVLFGVLSFFVTGAYFTVTAGAGPGGLPGARRAMAPYTAFFIIPITILGSLGAVVGDFIGDKIRGL